MTIRDGGGGDGDPVEVECEVRVTGCKHRTTDGGCGILGERGRQLREREGTEVVLARIEGKVDSMRKQLSGVAGREFQVGESEAKRVFLLMQRLEGGPKQWKAPVATVFRLIVLEGHSQGKTARLCNCVSALISRRVKTIESRFGMSIEQLRNFASSIVEMEASVKGDRVRKRNSVPREMSRPSMMMVRDGRMWLRKKRPGELRESSEFARVTKLGLDRPGESWVSVVQAPLVSESSFDVCSFAVER